MRTLISVEGILNPICEKNHISYVFNVEDNLSNINILLDYTPKHLEDREKSKKIIEGCLSRYSLLTDEEIKEQWINHLPVKNLITVSVDDSRGFRGAAHRQPDGEKLYISNEKVSPGMIPGEIIPGQWRVTVSTHALVTERCIYKLHVWTGGEE